MEVLELWKESHDAARHKGSLCDSVSSPNHWLIYEWGHPVILLLSALFIQYTYTQQFHCSWKSTSFLAALATDYSAKYLLISLHNHKCVACCCSLYLMAPRSMIACLSHKIEKSNYDIISLNDIKRYKLRITRYELAILRRKVQIVRLKITIVRQKVRIVR